MRFDQFAHHRRRGGAAQRGIEERPEIVMIAKRGEGRPVERRATAILPDHKADLILPRSVSSAVEVLMPDLQDQQIPPQPGDDDPCIRKTGFRMVRRLRPGALGAHHDQGLCKANGAGRDIEGALPN